MSETAPGARPGVSLGRSVFDNTLGHVVARGASVVRVLLVAHLVGPEVLGVFGVLVLVFTYGSSVNLGFFDGSYRLVPSLRAAGEDAEAEGMRDTAWTASLGLTVLLVLALSAYALAPDRSIEQRFGLPLVGLAVLLQQMINHRGLTERWVFRFRVVRNATVLRGVSELVLSVGLAPFYGLWGLLAGLVGSQVLSLAYLWLVGQERFRVHFSAHQARRLVAAGFPILLVGFGSTFLLSADRIAVATALTATDMGYYVLAAQVAGVVLMVPTMAASVLYVRFLQDVGREDRDALWDGYARSLEGLALGAAAVGVTAAVAVDALILLLPEFRPGLAAVRLTTLAGAFFGVAALSSNALVALDRAWFLLLAYGAVGGAIAGAALLVTVGFGFGITGVAAVALAGSVVYCTVLAQRVRGCCGRRPREVARALAGLLAAAGLLVVLDAVLPHQSSPARLLLLATFKWALIVLASVPFWLSYNRRTSLVRRLYDAFRNRKAQEESS